MRALDSPRRRRRVLWTGAVLGVAALVAVLVVVVPDRSPPNPSATKGNEGPAQLASNTDYHLSAADRRKITALFERWMPAAVGRRSVDVAWALAGPELRSAAPLSEWRAGTMPVPAYPVATQGLSGWRALDVGRDYVDYNVLVHPRKGSTMPVWVFAGRVVRRGAGWAVDRIYTIAIMNPVRHQSHEIGPADFVAPSSGPTPGNRSTLGHPWILAAVLVPLAILLVPLCFGLVLLVRARHWKRKARASGRSELPPLPAGYRRT